MPKQRKLETPQEREQRLTRETQVKREQVAADDAAIDQMIRRNIKQYGA